MSNWQPITFEDKLLSRYLDEHPGELYLEFEVGGEDPTNSPRRIDGILIPGSTSVVHQQLSYKSPEQASKINTQEICLIEAKRKLNRNVIGQVEVGAGLIWKYYTPRSIIKVVVCGVGNPDLEWYCQQNEIQVFIYTEIMSGGLKQGQSDSEPQERDDIRKHPSGAHQSAFLAGWTDAVNGKLYNSIRQKKTHSNMGNLIGWIYGDKSDEFRLSMWQHYIDNSEFE